MILENLPEPVAQITSCGFSRLQLASRPEPLPSPRCTSGAPLSHEVAIPAIPAGTYGAPLNSGSAPYTPPFKEFW